MATIRHHFESVTDDILRLQLLANIDTKKQHDEADELHDAILGGFEWQETREGDEYWEGVHQQAYLGEIIQNL